MKERKTLKNIVEGTDLVWATRPLWIDDYEPFTVYGLPISFPGQNDVILIEGKDPKSRWESYVNKIKPFYDISYLTFVSASTEKDSSRKTSTLTLKNRTFSFKVRSTSNDLEYDTETKALQAAAYLAIWNSKNYKKNKKGN